MNPGYFFLRAGKFAVNFRVAKGRRDGKMAEMAQKKVGWRIDEAVAGRFAAWCPEHAVVAERAVEALLHYACEQCTSADIGAMLDAVRAWKTTGEGKPPDPLGRDVEQEAERESDAAARRLAKRRGKAQRRRREPPATAGSG
jgi:hypothetical protein